MSNRKHFLWYYVFSSQMRHLCGSLCIFVYKNADVDNFYSKSLRSMSKIFIQILGYYNVLCGTENIFCHITYFPHKCATFVVPFVFWFTKMLTLTIFTQNRRGVWLKLLYWFKMFYNVFCRTENIFCDITYFPHKCATLCATVVPFVFWYTKMWFPLYFGLQKCWRWQFLLKIVEEYG